MGFLFFAEESSQFIDLDLVEAKGDLIVGTADEAVVRLGTGGGANGLLLTLDSAEATGMKWAAFTPDAGSITKSMLTASVIADYEYEYANPKTIWRCRGRLAPLYGAGTYTLAGLDATGVDQPSFLAGPPTYLIPIRMDGIFHFNLSDYQAGSRTVKMIVRAALMTNATSMGASVDPLVRLYALSSVSGASDDLVPTFSLVSGATVPQFNDPAASSIIGPSEVVIDPAPGSGFYAVQVTTAGAMPAGAIAEVLASVHVKRG